MTPWKPLWTLAPGSRLDADHPEYGVLIPRRNTCNALHSGKRNAEVEMLAFDVLAMDGDDLRAYR